MDSEPRWKVKLRNFGKALARLRDAVEIANSRDLSDLEEQGLIQSFEFTHELAWKTMKAFLQEKGVKGLFGSKDTTKEAFRSGLISDGDIWMKMIQDRNLTSHTYDEVTARSISEAIKNDYFRELTALLKKFQELSESK
ncbi:MAG: nucleotidyltransferase [Bacteroidetes bacterium]|nr:MAG: nucleotidyltransferase [Bacteroidota bacterium]